MWLPLRFGNLSAILIADFNSKLPVKSQFVCIKTCKRESVWLWDRARDWQKNLLLIFFAKFQAVCHATSLHWKSKKKQTDYYLAPLLLFRVVFQFDGIFVFQKYILCFSWCRWANIMAWQWCLKSHCPHEWITSLETASFCLLMHSTHFMPFWHIGFSPWAKTANHPSMVIKFGPFPIWSLFTEYTINGP